MHRQGNVVSLAGLFAVTAFASLAFVLARRAGMGVPLFILVVPLPSFLYLWCVRTCIGSLTRESSPSSLVNLLLVAGLCLVVVLSVATAAALSFWTTAGFSTFPADPTWP